MMIFLKIEAPIHLWIGEINLKVVTYLTWSTQVLQKVLEVSKKMKMLMVIARNQLQVWERKFKMFIHQLKNKKSTNPKSQLQVAKFQLITISRKLFIMLISKSSWTNQLMIFWKTKIKGKGQVNRLFKIQISKTNLTILLLKMNIWKVKNLFHGTLEEILLVECSLLRKIGFKRVI